MTTKTLSEAEKARLIPGIHFMTEPTGRCAKVPGTGLGVWEIIIRFKDISNDRAVLAQEFDWLTQEQLNTALAYYVSFPREIDERIALEDQITPQYIAAKYGHRYSPKHAAAGDIQRSRRESHPDTTPQSQWAKR